MVALLVTSQSTRISWIWRLTLLARTVRWYGCAPRSWAGHRQRPSTSQVRGWAPPCLRSAAAAVRVATWRFTRSTRRCNTGGTRGSSYSSWAAPPRPHLRHAAGTVSWPARRLVGCSSTLTLTLILTLTLTLTLTYPDPNPDPNQVVCSCTAAATASGATRTRGCSSWLAMRTTRTTRLSPRRGGGSCSRSRSRVVARRRCRTVL